MRVPLRPAQLQRVAIGFTVAASHALATAPASVRVDLPDTTRRWGNTHPGAGDGRPGRQDSGWNSVPCAVFVPRGV
jgi:hypothetical protein